MLVLWTPFAWDDYVSWQSEDKKTLKRINALIKDIQRSPFDGLGKVEPLKNELSGFWSRRIDEQNRLVYRISGDGKHQTVEIISCKTHYA